MVIGPPRILKITLIITLFRKLLCQGKNLVSLKTQFVKIQLTNTKISSNLQSYLINFEIVEVQTHR